MDKDEVKHSCFKFLKTVIEDDSFTFAAELKLEAVDIFLREFCNVARGQDLCGLCDEEVKKAVERIEGNACRRPH